MLDSLKRHCERLAADHLDCENVADTYACAKVSITLVHLVTLLVCVVSFCGFNKDGRSIELH